MTPGRQAVVGLDILLLVAALLVVSYHFLFFSWVEPAGYGGIRDAVNADIAFPQALRFAWRGWVGVELFFVIAGFVITRSASGKSAADYTTGHITRLSPVLLFFSSCAHVILINADKLTTYKRIGSETIREKLCNR